MDVCDDPIPVEHRYDRLEPIGSGGLGEVYRARAVDGGEHVAIKVLRAESDPEVGWHRIRRELTALVSLAGHPNVVQLIDLVDVDGVPGIVMEYAPYGSVARFVAHPGGVAPAGRAATVPEIVLVARHASAALVVAHQQSIVHLDVKPHNLLIASDGRVMLCDFGVSALGRTESFRTRTHARSPHYSSPEGLDDLGEVTAATDVYSLGATLLHLHHGAPPTLQERLGGWSPERASNGAHGALDSLIASCLHPAPSDRPTAVELLERFERLDWTLEDRIVALDVASWSPVEPITAIANEPAVLDTRGRSCEPTLVDERRSPPTRPEPERRRGRSRLVAGAIASACVVGAATVWWSVREPASSEDRAVDQSGSDGGTASADRIEDRSRTITVVERPSGLADIRAEVVWPFDRVGQCLVQQAGAEELAGIDCGRPHDLQRIAIGALDRERFGDDAVFDAASVDREVRRECTSALETFVGVPAASSIFQVAHTRPGAGGWASGDRAFQCLIGIDGRRTIGDAGGSGR